MLYKYGGKMKAGMDRKNDLIKLLGEIDENSFVSNAHTSQHRVFGYNTTNIRNINTISGYIMELLPEFIKRKNNFSDWRNYYMDLDVQTRHKQKFKRLELAKILFRNVEHSPNINNIGEQLYTIGKDYGQTYLTFLLNLFLLSGKYFNVENQPLVEIEKILSSFNGDIVKDARIALSNNKNEHNQISRLLLATIFYNTEQKNAYNLIYKLLENEFSTDSLDYLESLISDKSSFVWRKIHNAGGIKGFKWDVFTIINYYLFKQSNNNFDSTKSAINNYIDALFSNGFNRFADIKHKELLKTILLENENTIKDIFEFSIGNKSTFAMTKKSQRKNLRIPAIRKYDRTCFFDFYPENDDSRKSHELNYFETNAGKRFLEVHHMIQMQNAKFFAHDIDILPNLIPLCPNCHKKIHNAKDEIVENMIRIYLDNADKQELMRNGIFVDAETMLSFYGMEKD
jgi:uncharacterized protein (UPF0297 family)